MVNDKLTEYCKKCGLKVNIDKTIVRDFRNGGALRKNKKWYLNDVPYIGLKLQNVSQPGQ